MDYKIDSGAFAAYIDDKIGANIRRERIRAGLTQADLGNKIGVSGSMISQYESNAAYSRRPKWETVARIADALNISIERLIDISPKKTYWAEIFCAGLAEALALLDPSDCVDAGFDLDYALSVANGEIGFSFDDACNLCDALGLSLDELLGWKERK